MGCHQASDRSRSSFFFSSRRRHTRSLRDWSSDCALPICEQLQRFVKVTKSYWPGLFACYGSKDIPRTNNDLEHLFGSHRYHERRASGRKRASPGLVVMRSEERRVGKECRSWWAEHRV